MSIGAIGGASAAGIGAYAAMSPSPIKSFSDPGAAGGVAMIPPATSSQVSISAEGMAAYLGELSGSANENASTLGLLLMSVEKDKDEESTTILIASSSQSPAQALMGTANSPVAGVGAASGAISGAAGGAMGASMGGAAG